MSYMVKQSSTAFPLVFLMVDSTDHVTGKTGLSPTVTLSKAGGSFASPVGAVSEIASGWYKVAGNATDSATLGPLVLHATGAAADPSDAVFEVVVFDPQAALATPTNITAGIMTTVTNLTNAASAGDLTAAMKASVNAEVVDAVNVDTYAEPGQGAPAATTSLAAKINYLYKSWRNKKTQTATQFSLLADDATTVDQKATVSDDGTTTSVGELATGP